MMIFSHYFTAHLLTRGVFLSTQLSYHGKPASFSFRYHPKHGGSLSHARGVAQEIQPIFRCSNGAEDVHPYQSEDDTHRYSLDVQKKGENYLTIFASQQSMITCFFLSFLIPPLCFSKVIPGSLAKILAPPGGCGMYKHPNKRWEICQATAGSSATSRVRNVWKRQLQLMWFCSLQVCFWISTCDISFVSGFVSPNSFQVDFRSCLPMIINIPQHAVLSRTWQSLRFGMTCNRKFLQPLSYWVVKVGGKLSLFCFFLAHLHVETVVSSLSSKYPKVGVNHQDQALRNWFEILVTHFSIFSNQQLIVSLYSFKKKSPPTNWAVYHTPTNRIQVARP